MSLRICYTVLLSASGDQEFENVLTSTAKRTPRKPFRVKIG